MGVEGVVPLLGDFRVIVCLTSPQMNDFCDLLGTLDAPVSKIASVKETCSLKWTQYRVTQSVQCTFMKRGKLPGYLVKKTQWMHRFQ